MGLDNYIRITYKPKKVDYNIYDFNEVLKYAESITFNKDNSISFDILYWRKWWSFRNYYTYYLNKKYNINIDEMGKVTLDIEDINELYDYFDDIEGGDDWLETYWSYEECIDIIERDKRILKDLKRYMKRDKDKNLVVTVEFIDSIERRGMVINVYKSL